MQLHKNPARCGEVGSLGSPNMTSNEFFGKPISVYTRRQAIEDGTLVDLTPFEITRQHWKMPLACSATVWTTIEAAVKEGKHLAGVLHDVFLLAKLSIKPNGNGDRVHFTAIIGRQTLDLIMHCGPGDDAIPVLTLMTRHDD